MLSGEEENHKERGSLALCGTHSFSALGLDSPGSVLGFKRGLLQVVLVHAEKFTSLGKGVICQTLSCT